jgi:capsular polysaccharide export protein
LVVSQTHRAGAPRLLLCFGFGLWKHGFVRAFLRGEAPQIRFCWGVTHARLQRLGPDVAFVVWGQREPDGLRALAQAHAIPIWRMEDGFLRSVGLGTDFRVPMSLVIDRRGIYFDPRQSSDLEHILEHDTFSQSELERAAALRQAIVRAGLSKYNFAPSHSEFPRAEPGRKVVLVPGQVEDDASIASGTHDVTTNAALLRAVRANDPTAFIVYKPHPDVLTGHRRLGTVDAEAAARLADAVVTDVPLHQCIEAADAVHTMTSLVGFEALLRKKPVFCYGQPFYSGWGLTSDRHPLARRTRKLELDMLVAGALIRYPRYIEEDTWASTTPERVVETLELRRQTTRVVPRRARIERRLRSLRGALRGVFLDRP